MADTHNDTFPSLPSQRTAALLPQELLAQIDVSEEATAAYRAMRYEDFLLTDYWSAIRDHLVSIVAKCQMCSARARLRVHHNTYDNHGAEHLHLEDLTVICERCHTYFHALVRDGGL